MNQISEITTPQPPSIEEYADVENVADFLETAGIRMHVLQIHENPHRIAQEQNSAFLLGSGMSLVYREKRSTRTWMDAQFLVDEIRSASQCPESLLILAVCGLSLMETRPGMDLLILADECLA